METYAAHMKPVYLPYVVSAPTKDMSSFSICLFFFSTVKTTHTSQFLIKYLLACGF